MNADMLAAGVELGDRYDFDVVHGHDWLVAVAGDHLAKRFRCPLAVTIHATEFGRHQGWVDKHPQSHIHGVERWMANRADRVITCSAYMREHVADIYGLEEERIAVIPNGIDPADLAPVADLDARRQHVRVHVLDPGDELAQLARAARLAHAVHHHAFHLLLGRRLLHAAREHVHLHVLAHEVLRQLADVPREAALDQRRVFPGED